MRVQASPSTPNAIWIEHVKPAKNATPRTTCATSTTSRGSYGVASSMFGSYDDLGDGGAFEKLFAAIPEHLRSSRVVNFYDNQLDWSACGVHELFQTKIAKPQDEEMVADWTVSNLPRYKNDFWELQRDWSQEGLPIKQLQQDVIIERSVKGIPVEIRGASEIPMSWSHSGIPHQFLVGTPKARKLCAELMVNWSKRGVPVKNSWWCNPMVDWSQDKLPEIWENATPNEIRFMSFMPGPFNWSRPSFWDMPMVDWSKHGLPRIFRKVCEKPAVHPREALPVDWSTHGMPIAFRRLQTKDVPWTIDWSTSGVPINNYFVEERGLDWSGDGTPQPFKVGARYPEVPICDWSGTGLPLQMPRASASDDILCINWKHKGMPKEFRHSSWDQLMLDWCGSNIPRAMRFVPDRCDFVFAKRLKDFFKPPADKKSYRTGYELRVDWTVQGIPSDFRAPVEPKQSEELSLDWSCRRPPTPFRSSKWDILSLDWSAEGVPRMDEKGSKWNPLVIDWVSTGKPQGFRMAPEAFWDGPPLDWTSGIPPVFLANIGREHQMEIDWSVQGVPKKFHHMGKQEKQLRVNWLSPGLPVHFTFWNHTFVDWSIGGIPHFFNVKDRRKDFRQTKELMINWSKKGAPKVFHTTKWDFFAIDWSVSGLHAFGQIPGAKTSSTERHYLNLDWSLTGLPTPSMRKRFMQYVQKKDWAVNWSQKGVPLTFKRDLPELMLDWSVGMPYRLKQGEFDTFYAADWSLNGLPDVFVQRYLDMPYVDWSGCGIPHIFNVNTPTVTCRICRLNPQPIKEYIFDWSARGLPLKTTFYDYPVFDWSAKGLPIAGEPQRYEFDWSAAGVPFPEREFSGVFEAESLRLSELLEPRTVTIAQEDLCFEGKDLHLMSTVHMKHLKTDLHHPWSRLTDNRREAKFLSQARRTKKTKRVMRYLRYIKSKQMETSDRKEKNRYLTTKRNRQRIDKRVRRGDSPYEGEPYIDEVPGSSFFNDLPQDTVALKDEEKGARVVKSRKLRRKDHFFDWPHAAVAMLHQMDVDAMCNKYIYLALYRRGL